MKHLTDNQIDILVLFPERSEETERIRLRKHLATCAGCSERVRSAESFREVMERELGSGYTRQDVGIASRVAERQSGLQPANRHHAVQHRFTEELTDASFSDVGFLSRIVSGFKRHPAASTGGIGILFAMLYIVGTWVSSPHNGSADYAEVKQGVLTVFASDGSPLWSASGEGLLEGSTRTGFVWNATVSEQKLILIGNVHPHEGTEVVIHGFDEHLPAGRGFSGDSVYCFGSDGDLLWTYGYDGIEFEQFTGDRGGWWKTAAVELMHMPGSQSARIFALLYCQPFSPSALVELDGATGKTLGTFFHFGNILRISVPGGRDWTNGRILIAGVNNAYNRPFVATLDPDSISGFGPVPEDPGAYGYSGALRAAGMNYVLIPRSEHAMRFSDLPYGNIRRIWPKQGLIVLDVDEFPSQMSGELGSLQGSMMYTLDSNLRLVSLTASDTFMRSHGLLERQGHSLPPIDSEFYESLGSEIRYWNGAGEPKPGRNP